MDANNRVSKLPTSMIRKVHYRTAGKLYAPPVVEHSPAVVSARLVERAEAGRKAWQALHSYHGNSPEWFAKWEATIPHFDCSCTKDYREYKAANPPDFSSPEAIWLWGYTLHNWVNRKLGKPELTIDEARKLWRGDSNGLELTKEEQKRSLDRH
jgi:hypothetical protein